MASVDNIAGTQAGSHEAPRSAESATHYLSGSKGLVEIASMPIHHLANAHAKLLRDEPHRLPEIEAMARRLAEAEEE